MAEALLRDRLDRRGVPARVHSAGLIDAGRPASEHGVSLLRAQGLDLGPHRSRTLVPELLGDADLVLGMAREHVREAAVMLPSAWPRSFTLKELVRRGSEVGFRMPDQPLSEWLAKCHVGRSQRDLLGTSVDDDVADPYGGPINAYERTVSQLTDLVDRLVDLAFPPGAAT